MGLERNAANDIPEVAATAFVHEIATLVGAVLVDGVVFVGPKARLGGRVPLSGE